MADRVLSEEPSTIPTIDGTVAHEVPLNENGNASPSVVLDVVGGAGRDRNPALRDFPILDREDGEPEAAHLVRVVQLVDEAIASGGTHLLVPQEATAWLGDHPRVVETTSPSITTSSKPAPRRASSSSCAPGPNGLLQARDISQC